MQDVSHLFAKQFQQTAVDGKVYCDCLGLRCQISLHGFRYPSYYMHAVLHFPITFYINVCYKHFKWLHSPAVRYPSYCMHAVLHLPTFYINVCYKHFKWLHFPAVRYPSCFMYAVLHLPTFYINVCYKHLKWHIPAVR